MALDDSPYRKTMMSRAPVGFWMTQDKKATPQKYVDPEDALQSIIDNLKIEKNRNTMKAYIYAGIPVSTLAETIVRAGYAENKFNPDVAELIKPAVGLILTDMALENNFMGSFRLTPKPAYQEELDEIEFESTIMSLMEERNPKLARVLQMKRDEDEQQELKVKEDEILKRTQQIKANNTAKPAPTEGFITRDEETA